MIISGCPIEAYDLVQSLQACIEKCSKIEEFKRFLFSNQKKAPYPYHYFLELLAICENKIVRIFSTLAYHLLNMSNYQADSLNIESVLIFLKASFQALTS